MVLRLCFIFAFLLVLGCSNPYERDNPIDPYHVYTVTFNASGATGGTAPAAIKGSYSDIVTLPGGGSLERTGYVFYWADSTGKDYATGSSYIITGNVTLYAQWLPIYTVTFDANGATSGAVPAAMKAVSGVDIQLPGRGSLERTGYVFGGWNTDISGTGTGYNADSSYTVLGDVTLYARWLPLHTVTFNANGAATAPAAMVAGLGFEIQLPGGERSDYLFIGWNTDSSGTGTSYTGGSSYTIAGNVTLYAMWAACPGYNSKTHICDERDWQAYRITPIGTQVWMAENLNYDANGSKCYSNSSANCDKYGRLYDWSTATALPSSCASTSCSSQVQSKHRGVCPSGWHLPSSAEWTTLTNYVGTNAGTKLKATSGWNDYNGASGNGTDQYGFSALPGGYGFSGGSFNDVGDNGYWWSATESNATGAYYRYMNYDDDYVNYNNYYKSSLFSVRCLQD